jgi:oxygen-independent coproporphyrinogen-3 oxidase
MVPRHVYIHAPFCARRCSYCDFSIAVRRDVPRKEYLDSLERELSIRVGTPESWLVETLYLGGGTPSRLGAEGVSDVIEAIRARAQIDATAEITIEANPEDVSPHAVRAWRNAGVNRLSIGAQSFDERALEWMHRTHSARQTGDAVATARAEGIEEVSLDLIFALPESLARNLGRDLDAALELEPQHMSVYGLTVEPRTPLARWRDRGAVREAAEERYEAEFLMTHERLTAAGFEHYEVSSYALPGHRARHNSSYWSRKHYLGLGPSAHSFDGRRRRWNVAPYAAWSRQLALGADPVEAEEKLTTDEEAAERVYLGLRTVDGIGHLAPGEDRLRRWRDAGWAVVEAGRLRLTAAGWLRLDAIAADLTIDGSR